MKVLWHSNKQNKSEISTQFVKKQGGCGMENLSLVFFYFLVILLLLFFCYAFTFNDLWFMFFLKTKKAIQKK